tara:strand:+ start:5798 stop:6826 length:1029 start_codon:yes stop_codon:yes gene_type:complete
MSVKIQNLLINPKFLLGLLLAIILVSFIPYVNNPKATSYSYINPFSHSYKYVVEGELNDKKIRRNDKRWIKENFSLVENQYEYYPNSDTNHQIRINRLYLNKSINKFKVNYHLLGTDSQGRSLASLLLVATRNNLLLALLTVTLSVFFGTFLGILTGYFFNRDDPLYFRSIQNFIITITNGISDAPMLAWAFLIWLTQQIFFENTAEVRTLYMFIFLASTYYSSILSKGIRNHLYELNKREFLSSAEMLGVNKFVIIYRHIIKSNLQNRLLSLSIWIIIQAIFLEITLSIQFIGVGFIDTLTYGTLINSLLPNPYSINIIIPALFSLLLCNYLTYFSNKINE